MTASVPLRLVLKMPRSQNVAPSGDHFGDRVLEAKVDSQVGKRTISDSNCVKEFPEEARYFRTSRLLNITLLHCLENG